MDENGMDEDGMDQNRMDEDGMNEGGKDLSKMKVRIVVRGASEPDRVG